MFAGRRDAHLSFSPLAMNRLVMKMRGVIELLSDARASCCYVTSRVSRLRTRTSFSKLVFRGSTQFSATCHAKQKSRDLSKRLLILLKSGRVSGNESPGTRRARAARRRLFDKKARNSLCGAFYFMIFSPHKASRITK